MGKKTRLGKLQIMKGFQPGIFSLFFLLSLFNSNLAHSVQNELSVRSEYSLQTEPLTTEKIWILDPEQINPSEQIWLLNRHAEISGLKTRLISDSPETGKKWGVEAAGIISGAQGYTRGPGPWYSTFDQYDCSKSPHGDFITPEGAAHAVGRAGEYWNELLESEKIKLRILLSRVDANSEALALDRGEKVFRAWLRAVDEKWRAEAPAKARREEWKYYSTEAKTFKTCPKPKLAKKKSPSTVESALPPAAPVVPAEPSPRPTRDVTQLLARLPARLWNGLFTVRVDVMIGDKSLNGRFLIDSGAPKSVINPIWMENQGIYSAWVKNVDVPPSHVWFSYPEKQDGTLANWATVGGIRVSGFSLPLRHFLLADTDFFSPPDYVGSCCDGILGVDFLRSYPMEFQASNPPEVRIWPRELAPNSNENIWVKIHETRDGDVTSACEVEPDPSQKKQPLRGVRWASASPQAIGIHLPWQKTSRISPNSWKVQCGDEDLVHKSPATFMSLPFPGATHAPEASRYPATSIGIPVLAQGNFTFDLPNGKLWFSKEAIGKEPLDLNRSGLNVFFRITKAGERELVVKGVRPGSPASALVKAGLRRGMVITQIGPKEPADLDYWQVQRWLAGEHAKAVGIQWIAGSELKMAPLVLSR